MFLSVPLYAEIFFLSLDKTAFAGRIKPACRSSEELQSPSDQKWVVANSPQELEIKHKGMCHGPRSCAGQALGLIKWDIYARLIPVGLWPLQYPRSPAGRLTSPLPLAQPNRKGVGERREEEEEGISCRWWCRTPELSKWPTRRLILLMCKA